MREGGLEEGYLDKRYVKNVNEGKVKDGKGFAVVAGK